MVLKQNPEGFVQECMSFIHLICQIQLKGAHKTKAITEIKKEKARQGEERDKRQGKRTQIYKKGKLWFGRVEGGWDCHEITLGGRSPRRCTVSLLTRP